MSRTARRAVYATAFLLAIALVWLVMWRPRAAAVEESVLRTEAASGQEARLTAMVASAQRFEDGGDESVSALERARTAVPDAPELGAYLLFVDEAARATGCVVRALNPRPAGSTVKAIAGLQGIGVDLVLLGSLDQVQAFLIAASRLPRVMVIDEVQIDQESDRLVEMTLAARIFRTGPPDEAADAAAVPVDDLSVG